MPLPEPRDGESHDDFVDRCMGDENMREFEDAAQRRAVCESQWDDARDNASGLWQGIGNHTHSFSSLTDGAIITRVGSPPTFAVEHYSHIVSYVLNTPWAIIADKLAQIMGLLGFYAAGNKFTAEEVREAIGMSQRPGARASGAVQIIPLYGIIAQRMGLMTETSGGTSTEAFSKQFRAALNDPQIGAILIDVDSPGGAVTGVDELSSEIHAARGAKPVVAIANSLAASAAYWIATAADEMVMTPTAEVGSIGVLAAHEDDSAFYERQGIKTTLVSAGKYKTEANPYEPLSDDARAYLQERVNDYYDLFVKAVARNRGVSVSEVRGGFGEGRVVGAKAAKAMGMVDRVETMDETIARLQKGRRSRAQSQAELDRRARRLRAASRSA